jgi:hypothetical protein
MTVGIYKFLWVFSIAVGVLYITVGILVFGKLDLRIQFWHNGQSTLLLRAISFSEQKFRI